MTRNGWNDWTRLSYHRCMLSPYIHFCVLWICLSTINVTEMLTDCMQCVLHIRLDVHNCCQWWGLLRSCTISQQSMGTWVAGWNRTPMIQSRTRVHARTNTLTFRTTMGITYFGMMLAFDLVFETDWPQQWSDSVGLCLGDIFRNLCTAPYLD